MLLAKLRESLTVRLFCLTFAIVLAASATTFGLIALVTPVSYTAVLTDQITQRLDQLLNTLAETDFDDAMPILTVLSSTVMWRWNFTIPPAPNSFFTACMRTTAWSPLAATPHTLPQKS